MDILLLTVHLEQGKLLPQWWLSHYCQTFILIGRHFSTVWAVHLQGEAQGRYPFYATWKLLWLYGVTFSSASQLNDTNPMSHSVESQVFSPVSCKFQEDPSFSWAACIRTALLEIIQSNLSFKTKVFITTFPTGGTPFPTHPWSENFLDRSSVNCDEAPISPALCYILENSFSDLIEILYTVTSTCGI